MKRPMVGIAAAYAGGLLLATAVKPTPVVLIIVTFTVLAAALLLRRHRSWLIWPLIVLTGWTNLVTRTAIISPNDLRSLLGDKSEILTVRGTLIETPRLRIVDRDGEESWRTLAQVRVFELVRDGGAQKGFGTIAVTVPGVLDSRYFAGQPVEIYGTISRQPAPLAEGLFDYRSYLETRGFFYQLKTVSTNDWHLTAAAGQTPPLTDRFLSWSRSTLAYGLPQDDEPVRLLWGMTLGWRTALTQEVSEPFVRAGTMHLFAIDGLRIALISGILLALLRAVQIRRAWCGAITIPVLWFYTAATGSEPSAIRASIMMTIIIGGWTLKRPGDLVNSMAAASLVILLWDPRQLFEAGFQLSFFVVLIIALLMPKLERIRDRLLKPDPFLPQKLLPAWRRWFGTPIRLISNCFAVSVAAWVGCIPLTALYFHVFNPISPVANLAAVPIGTLALMSNLGSLITGAWLPWATELFNQSAWFFMSAMTWISNLATKIPGSCFYVPAPDWIEIILYYAILAGVLSGWMFSPARRKWSTAALLVIGVFYFVRWQQSARETEITVLPLNGGHCVSVDGPGRRNDWLMDCGNSNAVQFTLKPFLRARGVNRLPRLALTHGDSRAVGGALLVDDLFNPREVDSSPIHFRSRVYDDALARFQSRPATSKVVQRDYRSGNWQVLHPDGTDHFERADDAALVLRGNLRGARILLLSELGRSGQSALLNRGADLHADIVVAGLPAQGEPLSDALLEAISPRVIVVADSNFPANRRAGSDLQKRLAGRGVPVIYTRISGAVTITAGSSGWELRTMDGQKFSGSPAGGLSPEQSGRVTSARIATRAVWSCPPVVAAW